MFSTSFLTTVNLLPSQNCGKERQFVKKPSADLKRAPNYLFASLLDIIFGRNKEL